MLPLGEPGFGYVLDRLYSKFPLDFFLQWKKYLTTMQIVQFVIDIFIVYFGSRSRHYSAWPCLTQIYMQPTSILSPPITAICFHTLVIALVQNSQLFLAVRFSLCTSAFSSTSIFKHTRLLQNPQVMGPPMGMLMEKSTLMETVACMPQSFHAYDNIFLSHCFQT